MTNPATTFDSTDLALLNALQIHPRASWQLLGDVLGIDPATAARRWTALAGTGAAWVTTSPGPALGQLAAMAVATLECAPGPVGTVASRLADDPHATTIDFLAGGGGDLLMVLGARDLTSLSTYLHQRAGQLDGVRRVRSQIASQILFEGSQWRLGVLGAQQIRELEAATARRPRYADPLDPPVPARGLTRTDRLLLSLLNRDGRMSYAELAARLEVSAPTVRRRIEELESTGLLTLRCEFAHAPSGWPVTAVYWASAPLAELRAVTAAAAALPETRTCLLLQGERNLALTVYLRSVTDAVRFEQRLLAAAPMLTVHDRAIAFHTVKLFGRVLDETGRCVDTVPPDVCGDVARYTQPTG